MPVEYTKTCFVIMPFGKKPVGDREVEFDFIYDQVFVPAIAAAALPGGGFLEPRRTDKDFFAGSIELNPQDFDALSSLGGVYKRLGQLEKAYDTYHRATDVSQGNTYPLLNEVKLRARLDGKLALDGRLRFQLRRAVDPLTAQVDNQPPYNAPWSFFDLAEVRLYLGEPEQFVTMVERGLLNCSHSWQAETFLDSLGLLTEAHLDLPGLAKGLALISEAIGYLPK